MQTVIPVQVLSGAIDSSRVTVPPGTTGVHFAGVQNQDATPGGGGAGDPTATCALTLWRREDGADAFTIWAVSPWTGGGRNHSGAFATFGQDLDGLDPSSPQPAMTPPAEVYCTLDTQGTTLNAGATIDCVTGT